MFAVIKKRTITLCAVLAVSIFLLSVFATFISSPSLGVVKLGKTVVLDAGHGGIDGGVTGGVTGVCEADINLAVCKSLKNYLERSGYTVVMTRTNRDGLYQSSASNKKRSDMLARRDIINSSSPDLVVSVHQNFYPLESVKGAQVFYSADSEISAEIAKTTQSMLNERLGNERVEKSAEYYITDCTDYPTILVECGFLSNPQEEKLLVSATYQQKIAYTLFSAIHAYLGESVVEKD